MRHSKGLHAGLLLILAAVVGYGFELTTTGILCGLAAIAVGAGAVGDGLGECMGVELESEIHIPR